MKHGLLAIVMLLTATLVTAQADYIRFIYNPGAVKKKAPDPNDPNQQGQAGAQGAMANLPPALQQRLNQIPPAQRQAAIQQYLQQQGGGMRGGGGGRGGGRGGRGGMGLPGMGGTPLGGAGAMAPGAGGSMPPGMGMAGIPGAAGGPMDPNAQEEELDMSAIKMEVIVESSKVDMNWPQMLGKAIKVTHKWGHSAVDLNDLHDTKDIIVQSVYENKKPLATRKVRWERKITEYERKPGFPTPELRLELAEYALTHGLQEQFDQQMGELLKLKPADSQSRPAQAAAAYKKYLDVDFKRTNLKDDPVSAWADKLGDFTVKRTEHYLIRYDRNIIEDIVNSYAAMLESNYRAFYSWFAVKGKYRPTPEYRLTVVLSDKAEAFTSLQKTFETIALPADGFMSRRDNLTVMSGSPLEEGYESLDHATLELWTSKGWNKKDALEGKYVQRKGRDTVEDVSYAHTVALMLRAAEEQSERHAASHVGSLQLATASGLLPRTVAAPRWVQFGLGSFFETPPEAYWPGTGAPHWNYLTKFTLWHDENKLDKPDEALRSVVTDAYFHALKEGLKDPKNEHDHAALLKARTMTWSLTYFLAQQKLDQLLSYYQELEKMPRDMELGEEALAALFAKAFDLGEGPAGMSSDKAHALALEWYRFMKDTHLEVAEVLTIAKKREEARLKKLQEEAKEKMLAQQQAKMQEKTMRAQFQSGFQAQQNSMPPPGMAPGQSGFAPGGRGMQQPAAVGSGARARDR
jgi:hypothetical protein